MTDGNFTKMRRGNGGGGGSRRMDKLLERPTRDIKIGPTVSRMLDGTDTAEPNFRL